MKIFTLILMSFFLVSCGGGGKGSATLSVLRGFAFQNTSFSDGIYITGQRVDGPETFSAAILAGNTTTVSIPFGVWNFKVVGWDGGASPMQGTPFCKAISNFAFTTEGQQLQITTSEADCFSDSTLSGTSQHQSANVFRGLVVNSCGAMFNPSSPNALFSSGQFNFCSTMGYEPHLNQRFTYYKVMAVNKNPDGTVTPGISSACLATQTSQPIKFPNRIPVTLKFYADSSCTQSMAEYDFSKGLDFSQSPDRGINKFDWSVTADSVNYFVTVASGASRRGTTAFMTETPAFLCSDGSNKIQCPKLPSTSAGVYYLDPDAYATIRLPNTVCGPVTPSALTVTIHSCIDYKGSAYLRLKVNSTTPVNGSFTMGANTYSLKVGNTTAGLSEDRVRDAYQTLKRTIGFRDSTDLNNSLADDFDEEEIESLGALSSAVHELSSLGAGGVFHNFYNQCSASMLPQVVGSYLKNGFTYSVFLSGITGAAPGFIARTDEPDFMTPENRFNRRIIVRKLSGAAYITEKVIDFSCDNFDSVLSDYSPTSAQVKLGKLEEQRTYSIGTRNYDLKKIVFWNTSKSNKSRFDVYRSKEVRISGTISTLERNFYRVTKSESDDYNHFKVHGLTYQANQSSSAFDESIIVNEIDGKDISGIMTYSHKRLMDHKIDATTIGTIFGEAFKNELLKVRFGYNLNSYEQEQSKVATSSNGKFIQARKTSTKLQLRYTTGSTITSQLENFTPDNIAADISANGTQMIAAANDMATLYYYVIDNGTVTPTSINLSTTPTEIKAAILDDGSWVISYVENNTVNWITDFGSGTSPYPSYIHSKLDFTKSSSEIFLSFLRSNGTTQYAEVCRPSTNACSAFASRVSATPFTHASIYYDGFNLVGTAVHDGAATTAPINISNLIPGTVTNLPVTRFRSFEHTFYTNLNSALVLRSAAGTDVEVEYPYFNPTISGFEMKPFSLQQSLFNNYFSSSFATQAN